MSPMGLAVAPHAGGGSLGQVDLGSTKKPEQPRQENALEKGLLEETIASQNCFTPGAIEIFLHFRNQ